MLIDLLFLAWNRREFTEKVYETMIQNTDWDMVQRLVIYDDGSVDGTREYLEAASAPVCKQVRRTCGQLGPVAIMGDFLSCGGNPVFAKIDSDTMLPPGWLSDAFRIFEAENLDLLGIEARGEVGKPTHAEPTEFIGGIGLMRTKAFDQKPAADPKHNRFGFTHWQSRRPQLRKGWLEPSLPVCLLNMVPFEPWCGLSDSYVERGWQRPWGKYPATHSMLWEWWA